MSTDTSVIRLYRTKYYLIWNTIHTYGQARAEASIISFNSYVSSGIIIIIVI